jgi:hypothetical protein
MDTSRSMRLASFLVAALMASSSVFAQQSSAAPAVPVSAGSASGSVVPRLVNYSGVLQDASGEPITDIRGVTFLLYQEAHGGAPVWLETQNVTPDKSGHYTVQLGTTRSEGLPASVFITGERWLAVQVSGETEQPRVLLVAVPYAMKAADAETVGGLPPSAFVLAAPVVESLSPSSAAQATGSSVPPPASSNVTTTGGTVNTVPIFTTATNIQNSAITQTGSGTTAKIGIGTTAPAAALDVKGGEFVRGLFTLPSTATATATKGANSQPEVMIASVFNSGTSTAVNQKFQLQAEPSGNNTATASGTLNLLYGSGTAAPAETGMKINNKGQITFATGQTFPGTGSGTVTSVGLTAPASDFTVSGSPVTTTGTLNLAWKTAPTSANTVNAIVKRDATGSFSATNITATGEFFIASANSPAIFGGTSSDGGSAIVGAATASGGSNRVYGVEGESFSTVAGSTGVLGFDMNTTYAGFTIGVQGASSNPKGMGVLGFDGANVSAEFSSLLDQFPVGVWGDGGSSHAYTTVGVLGSSDEGYGGLFVNNSSQGWEPLTAEADNPASDPFFAVNAANDTYCRIDKNGSLICKGTTNAVVPIYGGKRKVAMSSIESPQNWFEDAGSAELVNGTAVVALDPDFIQTVNTALDYKVFPVPNGDCKGLYVTNKTVTSFEVRELSGGTASIRFDYRIMALRKNYEKVRFADHTNDPDPRQRMEEMKQRRKNATTAPVGPVSAKQPLLLRPTISQ